MTGDDCFVIRFWHCFVMSSVAEMPVSHCPWQIINGHPELIQAAIILWLKSFLNVSINNKQFFASQVVTFEKGCGLWLRHHGVQILSHQPVTTGCLPCIHSFICSSSSLVQGIGFSRWRQGFESPWAYHLSPSVEGGCGIVYSVSHFFMGCFAVDTFCLGFRTPNDVFFY